MRCTVRNARLAGKKKFHCTREGNSQQAGRLFDWTSCFNTWTMEDRVVQWATEQVKQQVESKRTQPQEPQRFKESMSNNTAQITKCTKTQTV